MQFRVPFIPLSMQIMVTFFLFTESQEPDYDYQPVGRAGQKIQYAYMYHMKITFPRLPMHYVCIYSLFD